MNIVAHVLVGRIENAGNRMQAWRKIPDYCFEFEDPATEDVLLTVVFEVGFTEKYGDLLGDMRQWLSKTDDVQLVVIVNIDEAHRDRNVRWETESCKKCVKDLLRCFGNKKGEAKHAPEEGDHDVESDDTMYKQIRAIIKVEDWVGEMRAFVELWERGDQWQRTEDLQW